MDKLKRQLEHPFYKESDQFREGIKMATLKKAAEKYPEPFNQSNWTIKQLAEHAMAENYDQQNYIFGMYERMQQLEKEVEFHKTEAEYWRLKAEKIKDDILNGAKGLIFDKHA